MIEITIDGITKVYGSGARAFRAVDEVHLSIAAGELFFLLGPSGCGKTTLLRMIAGLIEPTGGAIRFGERDVTHLPVEKRDTALVFQNYALWPHMSVLENVQFGPRMRGVGREDRLEIARRSLHRVEMDFARFARRKPNQLSGGQQQRVAVARALASAAQVLLMDEPLSNLDARLRSNMRTRLRSLVKSSGTTGIYVTHDQKEALSMADRIAVMRDGRICQVGTPDELYNRPATHFVADFLGDANFLEGELDGENRRVRTPQGTLRAEAPAEAPAGSAATACVRPERLRLLADGEGPPAGSSVLEAKIELVTFLGEVRQITCRLGGERWLVTELSQRGCSREPGQTARLCVKEEDVTILTGGVPEDIREARRLAGAV
jgi:ABC-type Fe3+/spermidine/putrescine transport system ATPase subunit